MVLMRAFSRFKSGEKGGGQISIPTNIIKEVGFKDDDLVEIKVEGQPKAQFIKIHRRKAAQ